MEGPWSAQGHGREHDSVLGGTGSLERTGAWGLEYGRVQGPVREHDSVLEGAGKDSLTA